MSYLHHYKPKLLEHIYAQVLSLLKDQRHYREPKVNTRSLAQLIGCDHRAISAALVTGGIDNFPTLLARLRTQEACRLLRSDKHKTLTLEEVAFRSGFATRQSFYNAFSKYLGTTPRQYRLKSHAS